MTLENPAGAPPPAASSLAASGGDADVRRLAAAIGLGMLPYRSFANAPVRQPVAAAPPIVTAVAAPPIVMAEAAPPVVTGGTEPLPPIRVAARALADDRTDSQPIPAAANAAAEPLGQAGFPLLAAAFRHDPARLSSAPPAPTPVPPPRRAAALPPPPAGGQFRLMRAALAQGERRSCL